MIDNNVIWNYLHKRFCPDSGPRHWSYILYIYIFVYYRIWFRYSMTNDSRPEHFSFKNTTDIKAIISNLEPNTVYSFSVKVNKWHLSHQISVTDAMQLWRPKTWLFKYPWLLSSIRDCHLRDRGWLPITVVYYQSHGYAASSTVAKALDYEAFGQGYP